MRKKNDIYWKGILEDLFPDFLRFLYPDADERFDFSRGFDFLDKELEKLFPVDNPVHPKYVDKLVKVFTKDGKAVGSWGHHSRQLKKSTSAKTSITFNTVIFRQNTVESSDDFDKRACSAL